MAHLSLSLLGPFQATLGGEPMGAPHTHAYGLGHGLPRTRRPCRGAGPLETGRRAVGEERAGPRVETRANTCREPALRIASLLITM
jgi:hypothetical protein